MEVLKDISQLTKGCGVTVFVNEKMIEYYKRMILCHENRIKEKRNLKE